MEPMHREKIISKAPSAAGKIVYLREYDEDPDNLMIPDPIGRSAAFYRASFGIIKRSIEGMIKWLKQ